MSRSKKETWDALIEPAPIIDEDGNKRWYKGGLLHRENDQPAIVVANGDKHWMQNGQWHRVHGPAILFASGYEEYWIDGKMIDFKIWNQSSNNRKRNRR